MNDGGAEQNSKSILETQKRRMERLIAWLSKHGLKILAKLLNKTKKDHFIDPVELCRKDPKGKTRELVHTEGYDLTYDEMMLTAAKARKDGVLLYFNDRMHPDKKYSVAKMQQMSKHYDEIFSLREELKNGINLPESVRKSKEEKLKELKSKYTNAGKMKAAKDKSVVIDRKIDELKSKGNNLSDVERQKIIHLESQKESINKEIDELAEMETGCFQCGCNKVHQSWLNERISDINKERTTSMVDINKDRKFNEYPQIKPSKDVIMSEEAIKKADPNTEFCASKTYDFTEYFTKAEVTSSQYAYISGELEGKHYSARKGLDDKVEIRFNSDDNSVRECLPDHGTKITSYGREGSIRITEGQLVRGKEYSLDDLKKITEACDACDKPYMIEELPNGKYNISLNQADVEDIYKYAQKKTGKETNEELTREVQEKAAQEIEAEKVADIFDKSDNVTDYGLEAAEDLADTLDKGN